MKLVDVADPNCTEWIEFDGVCEAWPNAAYLGRAEK